MTEAEEQELRALGADLAGAQKSPWEPCCVALVFATARPGQLSFTMQQWIDLEAIRSPLLEFQIPDYDESQRAAEVFGLSLRGLPAEEAVRVADGMRHAVEAGLSMALRLRPPAGSEAKAIAGCGRWLMLFTFLTKEAGQSRTEALAFPVGQALALLTGTRLNQGWEPQGETYADRDVIGKEAADV